MSYMAMSAEEKKDPAPWTWSEPTRNKDCTIVDPETIGVDGIPILGMAGTPTARIQEPVTVCSIKKFK